MTAKSKRITIRSSSGTGFCRRRSGSSRSEREEGSIAWIDPETGILKVGPQGAGASPGPVCYQVGGSEPTVSDADLVLGYLNENYFLGGKIRLNKETAERGIAERLRRP